MNLTTPSASTDPARAGDGAVVPSVRLVRRVRVNLNPQADPAEPPRGTNGYGGTPAPEGLFGYHELEIHAAGPVDPVSGYLVNIKAVDDAIRRSVYPLLLRAAQATPAGDPLVLAVKLAQAARPAMEGRLRALVWHSSPYLSLEVRVSQPDVVLFRQRFDFAASHRLSIPSLPEEENLRLFGKCSYRNGHGHNYQFEPCIAVRVRPGLPTLRARALEDVVERVIIQRFDHKHLNLDTDEFRDGFGLNPTVENIAKVFFELLAPAVAGLNTPRAGGVGEPDLRLRSITVWETDRTSAVYPG